MKAFALIVALLVVSSVYGQDCVYDKDGNYPYAYEPLLVALDTWISIKPVTQGTSRVVNIAEGSTIVVACPGNALTTFGTESKEATCTGGSLYIDSVAYDIMDLSCDSRASDTAIPDIAPCPNVATGNYSSIGFDITGYDFLEHIKVCFEGVTTDLSHYASHVLYAESVQAADGNPDSPSFKTGSGFYDDYNPNDCYLTDNQDEYFTELTGNPDFIDLYAENYFSRGHLGPNADFLIEQEADASYYYINAMPQWMQYNGQNWVYLEIAVRCLAQSNGNDLYIWTGPYGQQSVLTSDLQLEPLYLCASQGFDKVPVPSHIWKVVYEESTDRAIAVITSNIPYQTTVPDPLCPSLNCSTIGWISDNLWFPEDTAKGYTTCCTVQDWNAVNPNAPALPTAGLLDDATVSCPDLQAAEKSRSTI